MITQEEYEILKENHQNGFRWIARDRIDETYVYRTEPIRERIEWSIDDFTPCRRISEPRRLFPHIKWEDEKPTRIDDLIRDYESHQVIKDKSDKVVIPQFVAEWIEGRKKRYTLAGLFSLRYMPDDVSRWIAFDNEHCEKMARAWLDGFVVSEDIPTDDNEKNKIKTAIKILEELLDE